MLYHHVVIQILQWPIGWQQLDNLLQLCPTLTLNEQTAEHCKKYMYTSNKHSEVEDRFESFEAIIATNQLPKQHIIYTSHTEETRGVTHRNHLSNLLNYKYRAELKQS